MILKSNEEREEGNRGAREKTQGRAATQEVDG
jgi:hypothetical protein